MEELSADKQKSNNWCCLMDNLPVQGAGDGPMPYQPTKLFEWLSAKNLPLLEDETPPPSFFEVLENAEIAFHCTQCDKLLVSLDAESLQRIIGTQTQMQTLIQAQTQTHNQMQNKNAPNQNQINSLQQQTQTSTPLRIQITSPTVRRDLTLLEDLWLLRQRSFWSLLKTLMLCISILNGCYLFCRGICRMPIMKRIMVCLKPGGAPPTPPAPLSLTSTFPILMWSQLCRIARKLHII